MISTPAPTPIAGPTEYIIPATTKVLSPDIQGTFESVSPDGTTIIFSRSSAVLASLEPGDILVSDVSPATPYGLLRKVRTIRTDGEKVIVETEDARLIEAIHKGHLSFTRDLRPQDIRSSWLMPGVTFHGADIAGQSSYHLASLGMGPAPSPQSLSYTIDTDLGTGGKLRVVGNASLEPKLEADLDISCNEKVWGICAEIPDLNFMTRIAILEHTSLSVKGNTATVQKKIEIARHEFAPFTFSIGPVPIVFTPILSVYLKGDGTLTANVEYAVQQRLTLAAGFRYNSDSGFENLSEASSDFSIPSRTFNGRVDLRGVVGGEFQLLLYGVIGPFASLEAGPRFRASLWGLPSESQVLWRAEGCMQLFAGVDSDLLDLHYQAELYKACATFGEGANQPPSVSIQSPNAGTQVYQGETVKLRATVFDPDGQTLECRWSSDPAGNPFPLTKCERASVVFNTPGNRTLTLTATDPTGAHASAQTTFTVLPPPEILVAIEEPADGSMVGPDETITLSGSASNGEGPYKFSWSIAWPTDAAGNSGKLYKIGSGANLTWRPSSAISFPGCEVNGYGRLILTATDANGFSGTRSIGIMIVRIC